MAILAKIPYCDVCWEYSSKFCLENNISMCYSGIHEKKLQYQDGTGCDICKTDRDPLLDHYSKYEHRKRSNYVPGSGCNVCKKSEDRMRSPSSSSTLTMLETHNIRYEKFHESISRYEPGTGCDICCIVIPRHIESKEHRITARKKSIIESKFIAPKLTRVKSARK